MIVYPQRMMRLSLLTSPHVAEALGWATIQKRVWRQDISMVEVGRRHGWPDDAILMILRRKVAPIMGQLEAISQEMDITLQTLTGLLEK
jgi:hypothetical protein